MKKEIYSNSVFLTLQNFTVYANIEAHMSILCSISMLVSMLGAGPEMFKNLGKSTKTNQPASHLSESDLNSPCCIGCQSIFEPGGAGSPFLCQKMVSSIHVALSRDCRNCCKLARSYTPSKTGPGIGHHLSDKGVLKNLYHSGSGWLCEYLPTAPLQ